MFREIKILISIILLIALFGSPAAAEKIARVEVEGNVFVPEKKILLIAGINPGDKYEPFVISQSIKRLMKSKNFRDVVAYYSDKDGEAVITLKVREYPRIQRVSIEGNDEISRSDIEAKLKLREGLFARPDAVSSDIAAIKQLYAEKGYAAAEIRADRVDVGRDNLVNVRFIIEEGDKVEISNIDFIGNGAISSDQLRDIMETSIDTWFGGGEFNPDVLEQDFDKIKRLYAEYGYLSTEVSLLRKAPGRDREHIDLYIKIDEGPRSYVGDVTWSGNEVVADSVIEKSIVLEKGQPLSIAELEMTQAGIQNLYMEKGYIWSRIIPGQKVNRSDIDIRLDITENNQARIKEIKISGNTKTFENVIRRELDIYPGELFILKDVRRSVREIFQLGYFQGPPMINPERVNEEGDINLLIEVEEKQTGNFKSGFGFSQLNKLTGFIGLSETNFLGRGKSISINWEFGKYRENMNIQYSEAHLFNTETYFSASVYNWIQNRVQQLYYSDRRKGFSLQFGHPLPYLDYTRAFFRYRYEQVELSNFNEAYSYYGRLADVNWPMNKSSVTLSVARNSTDSPFHPTRGSTTSLSAELAGGAFGGNVKFIRYKADMDWFRTLFWKFTFHLNCEVGLIDGYGGSVVEDFEKFRLGGNRMYALRGYDYYEVVPDGNDAYVGGRFMAKYTQEIVFPFSRSVHGLLFFDAGNVWNSFTEADIFNLKRGLGVGVRVEIPGMGNLGLDYGYGFDKEGGGAWEPHFNFGKMF